MRKEFIYPASDPKVVSMVRNFIDYIIKHPDDCTQEMVALNLIIHKDFAPQDFIGLEKFISLRTMAEIAVLPNAPKVDDITKDEATTILENIYKYIKQGENVKATYYIELLEVSFNKVGEISAYVYDPLSMGKVQPIIDYLFA